MPVKGNAQTVIDKKHCCYVTATVAREALNYSRQSCSLYAVNMC